MKTLFRKSAANRLRIGLLTLAALCALAIPAFAQWGTPTSYVSSTSGIISTCPAGQPTCTLDSTNTTPAFPGCSAGEFLFIGLQVHNVGTVETNFVSATGCGQSMTAEGIAGSLASGTFQYLETVNQQISGASATLLLSSSGQLVVSNVSGTPDSTGTHQWVGATSNAKFNPSSLPVSVVQGINGGSIDGGCVPVTTAGSSVTVTRNPGTGTPVWKVILTLVPYTGATPILDKFGTAAITNTSCTGGYCYPGIDLSPLGYSNELEFQWMVAGAGEPALAGAYAACANENDHFALGCFPNATTGTPPNPLYGPATGSEPGQASAMSFWLPPAGEVVKGYDVKGYAIH